MTESSSIPITSSISNSNPVTAVSAPVPALASPLPNGSLSDTNPQDEEEYTIKCICIYADDDGNTVYCPKCDTWQHIDCYYHGKSVPEEHFCADCFPRELDAKRATERQRRLREGKVDGGDRKVKRPTTKGQKKKVKDNSTVAEQMNGWHRHERRESVSIGRDQQPPPAKKPKTNHRTSGSIISLNGEPRKRASSNVQSYPSPSKSPQDLYRYPAIPTYTSEFLELYEKDEGHVNARDNEHTIQALLKLSAFRSDPTLFVNGQDQQPSSKSPFVQLNGSLDSYAWPEVSQETVHKEVDIDGKHPTWRLLRAQTAIRKDDLVGEVRGEVGVLEEYCQQKSSSNRWQELQHPDPFVFFHPHMNIYIDSRKEGTQFRYLRRSCKPNVTLKTFVSAQEECHHCFAASKDIPAGTELTAAWFIDPGKLLNVDANKADPEQLQSRQFDWVSRVLANFGDCACDGGPACLLAPFDRRYSSRPAETSGKEKIGRKKKVSRKHAVSPLSTGQATDSRAGSETLRNQEEDDQDDRRSTSESSRSGIRSRDITPVNVAALDANPLLGNNLTARELRKIQAVEKAFEQRAHGLPGQQKKKKRTSGGSTLNTPNATASKQSMYPNDSNSNTPNARQFQASNEMFAESTMGPVSPTRPSRPHRRSSEQIQLADPQPSPFIDPNRPAYRSISIQTEPEDCEMEMPPAKRRKYTTPTQRLLKRVFADRAKYEQNCKSASPNLLLHLPTATQPVDSGQLDIKMKDVGSSMSPISVKSSSMKSPSPSPGLKSSTSTEVSPTFPFPSQAAHTQRPVKLNPAPRLQLSTLPPVPTFPVVQTVVTPSSAINTPSLAITSGIQSPMSLVPLTNANQGLSLGPVTPSPAKKKLSLGDYMIRRNMAPTPTEKSQAQVESAFASGDIKKELDPQDSSQAASSSQIQPVSKQHEAVLAEAAAKGGALHGSAIDDTPMKDDMDDSNPISQGDTTSTEQPISESSTTQNVVNSSPLATTKSIPAVQESDGPPQHSQTKNEGESSAQLPISA